LPDRSDRSRSASGVFPETPSVSRDGVDYSYDGIKNQEEKF
jgi:hypothetical protein